MISFEELKAILEAGKHPKQPTQVYLPQLPEMDIDHITREIQRYQALHIDSALGSNRVQQTIHEDSDIIGNIRSTRQTRVIHRDEGNAPPNLGMSHGNLSLQLLDVPADDHNSKVRQRTQASKNKGKTSSSLGMSHGNLTVADMLAFQADNDSENSFDEPNKPQGQRTKHRLKSLMEKISSSLRRFSCF